MAITEQQYREAQEIVDAWNEQEYQKNLAQAKVNFPIGTYIWRDKPFDWGEIIRHDRVGNEVTIIIDSGDCNLSFYAKTFKPR